MPMMNPAILALVAKAAGFVRDESKSVAENLMAMRVLVAGLKEAPPGVRDRDFEEAQQMSRVGLRG